MCRVLSVYKELPASAVLLDTPLLRDAYDLEVVVVDIPEAVVLPYEWITETKPPALHGAGGGVNEHRRVWK